VETVHEYRHDPTHRPIVVVDIENSSGRPEYVRAGLQRDAHDAIGQALAEAGLAPGAYSFDERGDGALITLPSDASKSRLTDVCLHGLPVRLRRLAAQRNEFGRLRLRVGLNAGDISRTAQGSWLGSAVDTTFRLVDAQATKDALAQSAEAVMVLIISGTWFEDVVRPGLGAAQEHEFRPLTITSHEREFPAWLALPGVTLKVESGGAAQAGAGVSAQQVSAGGLTTGPMTGPGPASGAAASRDTYVFGGDQVQGNKYVQNDNRNTAGPR
jgi:hypothetical protein